MTVKLINCLVETLNYEAIVYCHWKSNFSLAQAVSGEIDLDLLVDRKSLSRTMTILTSLGFKSAMVKWGPETASIYHYYGFDRHTGQLIHVHLFSSVLTGESFVKSHLLPLEPLLLEHTDFMGQIRVTAKSAELVLFILRTFIKYGSPLDLMYLLRNSEDVRSELRWLRAGAEMPEALCLLKKHCPVIDEGLFVKCIDALNGSTSLVNKILVARRVRQRLKVYGKYSAGRRVLAYGQLLWGHGWRRLAGNKKNKTLRSGGAVIAFVGPEATGKSTLVSECGHWLGSVFAVRTVHAGKPPSSWLTAPVNVLLPLVRNLLPRLRTTRLEGHNAALNSSQASPKIEGPTALLYALRATAVAWDRRQLLLKVRRAAANGELVICDRYPSEEVGAMDSPRLRENLTKGGLITTIYNWLVRVEKRLYRQIPPPDVVLRLAVSIDVAKQRNRDRIKAGKETDAYVESRHRQSRDWHRSGTKYIYDIDTDQPLDETIFAVKKTIWESL